MIKIEFQDMGEIAYEETANISHLHFVCENTRTSCAELIKFHRIEMHF